MVVSKNFLCLVQQSLPIHSHVLILEHIAPTLNSLYYLDNYQSNIALYGVFHMG